MKHLLDTAEAHAAEHGLDIEALLEARLYDDMFPFWRQVPQACNVARRCVDRLSGTEIDDPKRPEPNLDALRVHLAETVAYIHASDSAAIGAIESELITAKLAKKPVTLTGRTYLGNFALPNQLFHIVTAYNILRSNGVKVGKHSYLRPLIDAGAPEA